MKKTPKGIYINFENLKELEQVKLFLVLNKFANDDLPSQRILFIEILERNKLKSKVIK